MAPIEADAADSWSNAVDSDDTTGCDTSNRLDSLPLLASVVVIVVDVVVDFRRCHSATARRCSSTVPVQDTLFRR